MSRRLMLVHAHPDDETIGTGVTMAKYAAEGAEVTLVTCTLGEEGEILLEEFSHFAADKDDTLGAHRQLELGAAMAELGVTDWRLLGGPGRFRDSGMIGTPPNDKPESFWRTDLLVSATEMVKVIRDARPQVVVTYDDFGGYGHPDHIQAHRVTHYAVALAASSTFAPELGGPWQVTKIYWTAFPKSVIRAGIKAMKAQAEADPDSGQAPSEFAAMDPDDLPFACEDDLVTTIIEAPAFLPAKMAALRAHGTQVDVNGGFFALADNIGGEAFGTEYYRLAAGPMPAQVPETDLFAGIEVRFSPNRLNYLLAYVVLGLVIGFAIGLIGSFLQASRMIVFGPWGVLILPWGLVLAIVLLLVLVRGGAWLASSRWGAGSVLVGWLIATIAMSTESPSGDLALSGGTRQWVYLLAGVISGAATATFPVTDRQ